MILETPSQIWDSVLLLKKFVVSEATDLTLNVRSGQEYIKSNKSGNVSAPLAFMRG